MESTAKADLNFYFERRAHVGKFEAYENNLKGRLRNRMKGLICIAKHALANRGTQNISAILNVLIEASINQTAWVFNNLNPKTCF